MKGTSSPCHLAKMNKGTPPGTTVERDTIWTKRRILAACPTAAQDHISMVATTNQIEVNTSHKKIAQFRLLIIKQQKNSCFLCVSVVVSCDNSKLSVILFFNRRETTETGRWFILQG